jgi:hypothetical protein
VLSTMYGIDTPTIQELLIAGGALDVKGNF